MRVVIFALTVALAVILYAWAQDDAYHRHRFGDSVQGAGPGAAAQDPPVWNATKGLEPGTGALAQDPPGSDIDRALLDLREDMRRNSAPTPPACTAEQLPPCTLYPNGSAVTYMNNGDKPLTLDLSPDQKLARAYAICERHIASPCDHAAVCNSICMSRPGSSPCGGAYVFEGCNEIAQKWLASPAKKAADDQAKQAVDDWVATDRAFIEEVVRSLK